MESSGFSIHTYFFFKKKLCHYLGMSSTFKYDFLPLATCFTWEKILVCIFKGGWQFVFIPTAEILPS